MATTVATTTTATTDTLATISKMVLKIITAPVNTSSVQNTTVTFPCEVMSTSAPSIEWWFTPAGSHVSEMVADQQGNTLPEYSVLQSSPRNLTLVVENVQFRRNHGTYTCRASSRDMNANVSAALNVVSKLFLTSCVAVTYR